MPTEAPPPSAAEPMAVHALNADRFFRGDVFGWRDESSPTGFSCGIVTATGPCTVYVRDILPGVMRKPE